MSKKVEFNEYPRDDSPTGRVFKVWIVGEYHTLGEFYLKSEAKAHEDWLKRTMEW